VKEARFPKGLTLLLELIAAVTVFAVAAGVCGLLLARAERISRDAETLEKAVAAVTSAAEELRAAEDPAAVLEAIEAHPNLEAEVRPGGALVFYRLRWVEEGREIWSLDLACAGEVAP